MKVKMSSACGISLQRAGQDEMSGVSESLPLWRCRSFCNPMKERVGRDMESTRPLPRLKTLAAKTST